MFNHFCYIKCELPQNANLTCVLPLGTSFSFSNFSALPPGSHSDQFRQQSERIQWEGDSNNTVPMSWCPMTSHICLPPLMNSTSGLSKGPWLPYCELFSFQKHQNAAHPKQGKKPPLEVILPEARILYTCDM